MVTIPHTWVQNSLWLCFIVCLFPLLICLAYRRTLAFKRRHIERILQGRTFESYKSAHAFQADASVSEVIESLFGSQYTVRSYVFPVVVNALTCVGSLALFLIKVAPGYFGGPVVGVSDMNNVFFYGLAGAFLWSLYDLIRRFEEADLVPESLCYFTLRMFIVAVLSCTLRVVFSENFSPLVAFALGAFPVGSLLSFLKHQAKTKIDLSESEALATDPDLPNLQGISQRTFEQLDRLCIDRIDQLAHTNPIKLLVGTNIDWELILDLIDQAILYAYLGDGVAKLRPMGIRGASDLSSLYEGVTCDFGQAVRKARPLAQEAASKLGLSGDDFVNVAQNIFWCPQVQFIRCLRGEANRWTQYVGQLESAA